MTLESTLETTSNKTTNGTPVAAESHVGKRKFKRRAHYQARKPRLRTLEEMDQRTLAAQKAKALVAGLESDLGGAENISVGRRELVKHCALLGALAEDYEVSWLQRQPVDIHEYLATVNTQKRLLVALGLDRSARTVGGDDDIDRAWADACRRLDAAEAE